MEKIEQTVTHMNHRKVKDLTYHKNLMSHKKPTAQEVDNTVQYLIEKFHKEQFTPLFRRACWYIEKAVIIRIMEDSFSKANNPLAYFITSIKRELLKAGK